MIGSKSQVIDNYIYLYHTDEWLLLPSYPDQVSDKMSSTFSATNSLSRTAPIYTYSHSGPRSVQISLDLHRDMLYDVNLGVSNFKVDVGSDYVDTLIRKIQSIAVPRFNSEAMQVVPPMVAVRLGNEIFVKGVVNGGVSCEFKKPILDNGKYAQVSITFDVSEIDPYDAESIGRLGSFRGITSQFKDGIYKSANKPA